MSRALGDLQYKNPSNTFGESRSIQRARRPSSSSAASYGDFVSSTPSITRRALQTDRRYLLVIVSDGVTDRTDDAALVQYVMKLSMRGMRASTIAQEVVTSSASYTGSDNASCIVVMLDGGRS